MTKNLTAFGTIPLLFAHHKEGSSTGRLDQHKLDAFHFFEYFIQLWPTDARILHHRKGIVGTGVEEWIITLAEILHLSMNGKIIIFGKLIFIKFHY
jgi:hypothetical protein